MRILAFGTYDVASHPRVGVLLAGLERQGHSVRELNRPLGIGTAGRVQALRSPRGAVAFAARLLSCWLSLAWGSLRFRGARRPDALVVGYLGHFDVLLARLLYPRANILLDHLIFAADTAADRRLDGGVKSALLRALDLLALRCATTIIVDTPDHRALVPEKLRERAVVVPVGAPDAWFQAREVRTVSSSTTARRPSVVFFGLFTPLQGTPTIARALRLLDEREVALDVTLIGSGQDEDECRDILAGLSGSVRLTWRDWVGAHELPAVVAAHDVCLGIFGDSPKAGRVVPNKAFQGMAAGCALVTSDTPVQRAVLQDAAFVPAADPEALADQLAFLARNPGVLEDLRVRSACRADAAFRPEMVTDVLKAGLTGALRDRS
ncbi:MAG: glycosyltransferase [Ancrocorticia sp.]